MEDLTFILPEDGVLVLGLKEQVAGLTRPSSRSSAAPASTAPTRSSALRRP
ncbi:MAG: hypothetical protein WDM85_16815 [Caulobacteraceae bacterium]